MKVGILYIAIGRYSIFWEEFYRSTEAHFLPEVEKHYFVFTDCATLTGGSNVSFHHCDDLGWPRNALFRSKILLSIKKEYRGFDYLFFFNGNALFLSCVHVSEIIPTECQSFLTVLSWDSYRCRNNPQHIEPITPINSLANIPRGMHLRYYQSGLYGGRTNRLYVD